MKKYGILVMIMVGLVAGLSASEVMDYSDISSGVVEISVSNRGLRFTVDEIKVRQGVTVRLTLNVTGGTHDWVLDEFGAATSVLRPRQSETVEFVADKTGTFEYYCSVTGHRKAGMVGNFIVVP